MKAMITSETCNLKLFFSNVARMLTTPGQENCRVSFANGQQATRWPAWRRVVDLARQQAHTVRHVTTGAKITLLRNKFTRTCWSSFSQHSYSDCCCCTASVMAPSDQLLVCVVFLFCGGLLVTGLPYEPLSSQGTLENMFRQLYFFF